MLESPGAAHRARRVAAIVLVALGLAACSGGRSPAGPDSAAAPATTATQGASATTATAPGSATTAPPGPGATTAPPDPTATAAGLAATLTRAERAIRDPGTPDAELPALGHAQQRAYRAVVRDPALLPTVLSLVPATLRPVDRKSTRLNSSHSSISYAVFCLKKKKKRVKKKEKKKKKKKKKKK